MKRTNSLNIKCCCLLKNSLHINTELSYYAKIVPSRFTCPVFVCILCAKFAESISREQHLLSALISHNYFRPVNKRRPNYIKRVLSKLYLIAFLKHDLSLREIRTKEILHHIKRTNRCRNLRIRILLCKHLNISRMIRLHMMSNQVIRLSSVKLLVQFGEPFISKVTINSIKHRNFFINNHIRVVRHSIRHIKLPLKKINLMIINTNISYTI